jgi:transcriptional regulator with XRE-family HTH domain
MENGRNIPMLLYRKRHGLTQTQAAMRAGITQHAWSFIERMQLHPKAREQAVHVAALLGVDDRVIAPPERDEIVFTDLDSTHLRGLRTALVSRDERADPFHRLNAEELSSRITDVLRTLTYREREILKLRYGLGDGYTYTLEEAGRIFKVTRERVRGVEAKAIRKLQHPVRAKKLEGFLDPIALNKPTIVVRYDKPKSHVARKTGLRWKALFSSSKYSWWGRDPDEAVAGLLILLSDHGFSGKPTDYRVKKTINRRKN